MPIEILMPALSPTMEEGKLAIWMVKEGDDVSVGMVLAEIETDKATMEVEAIDDGRIGKILVASGAEGVKVNTPIAILLADGEDASAITAAAASPSSSSAPEPTGSPSPSPSPQAVAPTAAAQSTTRPVATPPPAPVTTERLFISPLARRLATEAGIDAATLKGSGPHGRIIKRDVDEAVKHGAVAASPAKPPASKGIMTVPTTPLTQALPDNQVLALYEDDSYEIIPHDGMRRIIAERLTQSKQTIPHFYLTIECALDELLRARTRMNEAASKTGDRAYKLSVNDFVIKALALALQNVPAANASWTDSGMLRHRHSDIGVAVAVEGGLFTPIIRHAEYKSLAEISNEMKELAERARKRRLAPHEYQGGTTSISNLGMFGIKSFDAVINPPHATILAVGAGEKRPIVDGGEVRVATIMSCTLSCDHRVVDGALGAELLNVFKAFIEDPVKMLV